MRPTNHELKLKKLIQAKLRIDQLRDLIRKAPRVPLKNKIFAGHWRFFKVRADVLRSSIGHEVQQVVDACNRWLLGDKKDPNSYRIITYKGEVQEQKMNPLTQAEYDKRGFPEHFKRKWFTVEEVIKNFGTKNVVVYRYWPKIPQHMLEFQYKAAYYVDEQIKVGDYESEMAKLSKFIDDNHGWEKIYGNYRDDWDKSTELHRKKLKQAKKELKDYEED